MKRALWVVCVSLLLVSGLGSVPIAQAATAEVSITDFAFNPKNLPPILVGTTVKWTNNGATAHTVTGESFDSSPTCSDVVATSCIPPDGFYTHTFPSEGSFTYRCKRHSGMTGSITVESAVSPSPSPSPSPPPPPPPSPSPSPKPSPTASPSPFPSPTPRAPSPSPSSGGVVTGSVTIDQSDKGGTPVGRIIAIVAGIILVGSAAGLWFLRKTPA